MPQNNSSPQEQERRRRQLRLRAQLLAKKSGARVEEPEGESVAKRKAEAPSPRAIRSEKGFPAEKEPAKQRVGMRAQSPDTASARGAEAAAQRQQSGFTDAQLFGQAIIHGGLAAAGTMGGGMAAEGLLSKRLGIPFARSLGEAGGAGGTALLRQQVMDPGSRPDFVSAGIESGFAGGAGLLTSGTALAGADVGKIAPVFVDDIAQRTRSPAALFGRQRGLRSTFGTQDPSLPMEVIAGKSAEVTRGVTRVRNIMPQIRRKISPERQKKMALLQRAADDGVRIDPTDMINALEDSKIGTEGLGALAKEYDKFNDAVDFAIKRLKRVVPKSGGGLARRGEQIQVLSAGGQSGTIVMKLSSSKKLSTKDIKDMLDISGDVSIVGLDEPLSVRTPQGALELSPQTFKVLFYGPREMERMEGALSILRDTGSAPSVAHGGLTPIQLDELIRKQFRRKAFGASGEPSGTLLGEVFGDLNNIAQDLLSDALPPGVRDLNAAISARMQLMERAERMFGHGRSTEPGVTETALANAFRQNNTETAQMLNFIEEMAGPEQRGLARDMFELAKERAFSGDIREASEASGFFQNVFGRLARGVTKTASPTQSLAGPGVAGYRAFGDAQKGFEDAIQRGHNEFDRLFEIQRLEEQRRRLEIRKETDKAGP
ncbi:MAG: hypothetical protein ACYTEQ_25690 [Planctomycetota bacterium]|jgi:hypothetical protein